MEGVANLRVREDDFDLTLKHGKDCLRQVEPAGVLQYLLEDKIEERLRKVMATRGRFQHHLPKKSVPKGNEDFEMKEEEQ